MVIVAPSFSKSSVFKMCSVYTKMQSGLFKFLRFEERLRKAPFSRRISVDGSGRPNRSALSNFSGLVWTLSKCIAKNLDLELQAKELVSPLM